LDGAELYARPDVEFITVSPEAIRDAERQIAGCDHCRPKESQVPFDCILSDVLDNRGAYEFVLSEMARCPNCRAVISEKTPVEPRGGIEVDVGVMS